jgi:hypothetical protein
MVVVIGYGTVEVDVDGENFPVDFDFEVCVEDGVDEFCLLILDFFLAGFEND